MSSPTVSVVIPTYNRGDLLGRAIESVLRQHGPHVDAPDAIEVIVVDDASTDETHKVLARYTCAVTVIRNERNRERGASRNAGAEAARGHWLAFLDSDDEWYDDKLSAQLHTIGRAKASLTRCWLIDESGAPISIDNGPGNAQAADIDLINPYRAVPSALLIERELFWSIGGFPEERDLQGSEDWLFMAKLINGGNHPDLVDRPLVRYRVHSGNSTAMPTANLRCGLAAVNWLERYGMASTERAATSRADKYLSVARTYALQRDVRNVLRCVRCAASLAPPSGRLWLLRYNGRIVLERCVG